MIWDMCCVEHKGKKLLVTTRGFIGMFAYNLATNEREWRVKGRRGGKKKDIGVESITTDGRGHLLVCGYKNACIWMFSTSGNYLATIMRHRNLDEVQPWCINWSHEMSSLLVVHTKAKDKNFHITSIKEISKAKKKEQKDKEEEADTSLDVENFLDDLTQKDATISASSTKEVDTSEELEISVTENVEDLEKIRENLLQELAQVQEEEVTTTDNSQNTGTTDDSQNTMATDDSQNTMATDDSQNTMTTDVSQNTMTTDDSQNTTMDDDDALNATTSEDDATGTRDISEKNVAPAVPALVDDAITKYAKDLAAKLGVGTAQAPLDVDKR